MANWKPLVSQEKTEKDKAVCINILTRANAWPVQGKFN